MAFLLLQTHFINVKLIADFVLGKLLAKRMHLPQNEISLDNGSARMSQQTAGGI